MNGIELDLQAILAGADDVLPEGHRAGMVCFVGRPNVGKSTLVNALVGQKVAIVSEVPGTTRNTIRGVVTRDDAQLVIVDTPGVGSPKTLLGKRLNSLVRDTWGMVDVVCFIVDGANGIGPGDRYLAEELAQIGTPIVIVVTKEDLVEDKQRMVPILQKAAELLPGAEIVPTAIPPRPKGALPPETMNVDLLLDILVKRMPVASRIFPAGTVSDQPERRIAAEVLREKLIVRMDQEVPHSIAVEVEEILVSEKRDDLLEIHAVIHVERDSQKGIVIGKGGKLLKEAATEARIEIEALLGAKVFLTTHVKVAKEWQRDPKQLRKLGY